MATLINNAGVQHYANKMVLAENRKVGSKSLPTALSDIDNLIDEMKTQFDAEYGSALDMKLNNNENVFSVGTGADVDKKDDVENSFTDVELSGNSLVNLFDYDRVSCLNLKNNLDGSFTNTLCAWDYNIKMLNSNVLKPNTLYTLVLEVTNWTYSGIIKFRKSLSSNLPIINDTFYISTSGKFLILCRSIDPIDISETTIIFKGGDPSTTTGSFTLKPMILEGDWTNTPIPQYFEGMKSVGQDDVNGHKIEILSQSKNLFNKDDEWSICTYAGGGVSYEEPIFYTFEGNKVIVRGQSLNKDVLGYKCKIIDDRNIVLSLKSQNLGGILYYACYTEDWQCIKTQTTKTYEIVGDRYVCHLDETDIPQGTKYVLLGIGNAFASNYEMEDIMIEYGTKSTNYSPYQLNKKEISLSEPLRGLPNGVKDTIEKVNGEWKIVRRCGELTINPDDIRREGNGVTGDFRWIMAKNSDIANLTQTSIVHVLCNKYPSTTAGHTWGSSGEGMAQNNSGNLICLFLNKYKEGSEENKTNLKEEIGNNTKVIYQLATPIIEDISPVTLQCWKNGTIFIDEVLPVESTHTVALNKPAQIKRNIEELTALRKRVQALEDFYDQVALEQAHQLSLINHSIELDYNI